LINGPLQNNIFPHSKKNNSLYSKFIPIFDITEIPIKKIKFVKVLKNQLRSLPEISELDAKILRELLKDGRMGFDELAKQCDASTNKIWKRYKVLEKKGVIKGATTQVNFVHLGYAALATLLISVDAHQINQIMDYIGTISEIQAYRQYNSIYNIRAITNLQNLNELDQVKQMIRQKLPIVNLKTYLWTSVKNIPENLNTNNSSRENSTIFQELSKLVPVVPSDKASVDAIDKELVQKLTQNGRMSFSQIAKEMKIATNTVARRYNDLRKNGTIKVSIQVDPEKLGYWAILDFNLAFASQTTSSAIIESFIKIPDMIIITKTSGDYDMQLTAMVRDLDQMFRIQDEISSISSVTKFEVSVRKIPEKWPTPLQNISTM
jgi:Lrp/AsnC family transcriptional regulator for asnA, asnC and gidA